jgi:hypothetical protein
MFDRDGRLTVSILLFGLTCFARGAFGLFDRPYCGRSMRVVSAQVEWEMDLMCEDWDGEWSSES